MPSSVFYQLPERCTPTSPYLVYLSSAFQSCVPTSLAFLSTVLGVCSIISWLFAQAPQVYKNYRLQSTSGLSIYFLAVWLLGDLTNLLGALFTKQARWQVVVASYYVTVDILLCYQYFWYTYGRMWKMRRSSEQFEDIDAEDDRSGDVIVGISPPEGNSVSESTSSDTARKANTSPKPRDIQGPRRRSSSSSKEYSTPTHHTIIRSSQSSLPITSPKSLMFLSMICIVLANASPLRPEVITASQKDTPIEDAGRVLSWLSTVLYLGSRFPQIIKNHVRRSTAGLSSTLFIAAFCGNLFYSSSILTNPLAWNSYPPFGLHGWVGADGSDRSTWISLAAPFWLGAAGVLVMDATIDMQFLIYGEDLEQSQIIVRDREGRSKWRVVRGWMRGWIPSSPDKRTVDDGLDETRPLLQ